MYNEDDLHVVCVWKRREKILFGQALQTDWKEMKISILETGSVQPVNRDSVCGQDEIVKVWLPSSQLLSDSTDWARSKLQWLRH